MHSSLLFLSFAAAIITPALTIPAPAQYCSANQSLTTTTKYPNKCQIAQIFDHLREDNFTAFFAQVAPDVQWTLMGTHPLAGEYHNRTIFVTNALERLANTLITGTSTLELVQIVGGGDEEWSAQELHAVGVCKNGLNYDNTFSWVTRWNTESVIVQVRAWLDSALVYKAITENESPEYNYTDQRTVLEPGPTGINCATPI